MTFWWFYYFSLSQISIYKRAIFNTTTVIYVYFICSHFSSLVNVFQCQTSRSFEMQNEFLNKHERRATALSVYRCESTKKTLIRIDLWRKECLKSNSYITRYDHTKNSLPLSLNRYICLLQNIVLYVMCIKLRSENAQKVINKNYCTRTSAIKNLNYKYNAKTNRHIKW